MKRENNLLPYLWVAFFAALFLMPRYFLPIPLFVLTIIGGFYLSKRIAASDAERIFFIFLISYLLRIGLALVLYKLAFIRGLDGYFYGGDDLAYGDTGVKLANAWREGVFPSFMQIKRTMSLSSTMGFYQYYLALLMLVSNNSTFLPMFVNCSLSALSIFVLYAICRQVFIRDSALSRNAAVIGIGLFSFWPSLVFWSTLNFKTAPSIFLFLLITLIIIRLFTAEFRYKEFIKLFLCLAIFSFILHYLRKSIVPVIFPAAALACLALVFKSAPARIKNILKISLFIIVIAFVFIEIFGDSVFINNLLTKIDTERDLRAIGGSVIMPELRLESFGSLLFFLPVALFIAFVFPLPWQGSSMISLLSSPEMILWYILLPFFIRGLILSIRSCRQEVYFVLFFTVLYYLSMGLFDANAGTLFRHKALALPLSFIFIAAAFQKGNIFKKETIKT